MLIVVTPPTVEPITAAEAKEQVVIGSTADENVLAIMISAAREECEGIINRSVAEQTLEVVLDAFPSGKIELPKGPVTEVASIKYVDTGGVEQTLSTDDYDTDTDSLIARVQPVYGGSWPDTKRQLNAVRIRYSAGWSQADCPSAIKNWLLYTVATRYMQREGVVVGARAEMLDPGFSGSLLDRYRVEVAP